MPRPAGTPNRNKTFAINKLKEMYGDDFDPLMQMAANAVELQKTVNDINGFAADKGESESKSNKIVTEIEARVIAINAWDKVAQYVTPKLKAVEITGEDGGPVQLQSFEFVPVGPR